MHEYIESLFVVAAKHWKLVKTIELRPSETKYHSAYRHKHYYRWRSPLWGCNTLSMSKRIDLVKTKLRGP